jgi:hypothetical protein
MTKAELETKHLSDLHTLAAESGVERYRMLSRAELIDALAGGESGGGDSGRASARSGGGSRGERPQRGERAERGERRDRGGRGERPERGERAERGERGERAERSPRTGEDEGDRPPRRRRRRGGAGERGEGDGAGKNAERPEPEASQPEPSQPEPTPIVSPQPPAAAEPARPKRRRRRRRFGRRGKEGVTIQDLLLPPEAGRQTILAADSAETCTALLRGVAADLAGESKGPDPIVLLIDPGPEELADWKREAPQAEIVAAGQARHADDALAQASSRASGGEDVILLVDSLTRLASAYGDTDSAKEFFDAGRVHGGAGGGSLTVVVALECPPTS